MIYFSHSPKIVMQKLQDEIVRSNCVLYKEIEMRFRDNEEFIKFVEKWTERYQLTLSPKERYKKKKKGAATFDLIVHPILSYEDGFTNELIAIYENSPEKFKRSDFDFIGSCYKEFLVVNFYLFCNLDAQPIYDGSCPIHKINKVLKQRIEGAEDFYYIFDRPLKFGKYEFVRLTQMRSIKDELEGHEQNASDWTWRIGSESYSRVKKQGEVLINRWNQCIDKSEQEKQAYFEKHLKVLESYYGFRGVRKQVGTLWAKERKLFKAKYGEKYLAYYRSLNLKYIQRLKSPFKANAEPTEMINYMQSVIENSVKNAR